MENIDRFFDTYERIVPRCFGDLLVAVITIGIFAWVLA